MKNLACVSFVVSRDFGKKTDKTDKTAIEKMNTIKLFTVDLNQDHRGSPSLFVNKGIRGNISDVLFRLEEYKKPGDCILDLCSLRSTHGEFAILRTSRRDASNSAVRDILNENSGVIRIRLGEILSFKIADGPFVRVWVTFENDDSKVSWSLFNSGKIEQGLAKRLEFAVRVREGKEEIVQVKRSHLLENAFVQKDNPEDLHPPHVVENAKPKGRKTPKAIRRKKITDLPKTGTEQ